MSNLTTNPEPDKFYQCEACKWELRSAQVPVNPKTQQKWFEHHEREHVYWFCSKTCFYGERYKPGDFFPPAVVAALANSGAKSSNGDEFVGQYRRHPTLPFSSRRLPSGPLGPMERWPNEIRHNGGAGVEGKGPCRKRTIMGDDIAASVGVNPEFYKTLFCVWCYGYFPIADFVWAKLGTPVNGKFVQLELSDPDKEAGLRELGVNFAKPEAREGE